MEEIAQSLQKNGYKNYNYIDIESDYGHDAFLVELEKFQDYIKDTLNG
jgi:homoserine O-acetyltransferase